MAKSLPIGFFFLMVSGQCILRIVGNHVLRKLWILLVVVLFVCHVSAPYNNTSLMSELKNHTLVDQDEQFLWSSIPGCALVYLFCILNATHASSLVVFIKVASVYYLCNCLPNRHQY